MSRTYTKRENQLVTLFEKIGGKWTRLRSPNEVPALPLKQANELWAGTIVRLLATGRIVALRKVTY